MFSLSLLVSVMHDCWISIVKMLITFSLKYRKNSMCSHWDTNTQVSITRAKKGSSTVCSQPEELQLTSDIQKTHFMPHLDPRINPTDPRSETHGLCLEHMNKCLFYIKRMKLTLPQCTNVMQYILNILFLYCYSMLLYCWFISKFTFWWLFFSCLNVVFQWFAFLDQIKMWLVCLKHGGFLVY